MCHDQQHCKSGLSAPKIRLSCKERTISGLLFVVGTREPKGGLKGVFMIRRFPTNLVASRPV
jgi:hypothetical protein